MNNLYTPYKIFHYQEKIDSLPRHLEKITPPIHIRIKPTNVCAHNCWYCAYRVEGIQLGKHMNKRDFIPKDKMLEIIEDCVEMGVLAITFSGGGDPFYYPYLLESVRKLAQTPIKFAALTNGVRLQGEIAEIFAHQATWLRISLDGWDAKSYAKYRGTKEEEYLHLIQNLNAFKKLSGSCYLGISLVVDQENASHVYESIKKFKELGANSFKISPCMVYDSQQACNKYHENYYHLVDEQVKKAISDFADETFEIHNGYHQQLENFSKDYSWCPWLQINPVIGADRKIYSCHDKAYNLEEGLLGDIHSMRLKDWWMQSKEQFFSIIPSKVCHHHCIADRRNRMVFEYLSANRDHLGFV